MQAEPPEPFAGFAYLAPQIVAGEADVLPAQWCDVGEQFVRHLDPAASQVPDGAVEIDGVPKHDGHGEQGLPSRFAPRRRRATWARSSGSSI